MITQRQSQILAAIVKEYSQAGQPVGSEDLRQKYHFEVSPATIRNEMQALEKAGLVMHPHTSAGRIPTDQGHRYFVNKLMHHLELSQAEQIRLRQELARLQKQYLELGRSISKLLSEQAHGAAFALLPEGVATSGLSQVVEENLDREELKEVARFLDEIEQRCQALIKKDLEPVETFIGSDFSWVVSRVNLPSGQRGLIGIVGPKRMKYARNISLLGYVSKLLSSGLGLVIVVHYL